MKKIIIQSFVGLLFLGIQHTGFSQAFEGKGSKQLTIGLGLTQHWTHYPENGKGPKGNTSPLYGSLNFQMEFGIAKYVGIGGHLGVEYANNLSRKTIGYSYLIGYGYGLGSSSAFRSLAIPVGIHGNFHFLQLIADKSGKTFAEKMDVYAGISFGSGPAFAIAKSAYKKYGNDVGFILYGGPHVGMRYYFSSNIGVYVEAGYGKSYLNGGLSIKF